MSPVCWWCVCGRPLQQADHKTLAKPSLSPGTYQAVAFLYRYTPTLHTSVFAYNHLIFLSWMNSVLTWALVFFSQKNSFTEIHKAWEESWKFRHWHVCLHFNHLLQSSYVAGETSTCLQVWQFLWHWILKGLVCFLWQNMRPWYSPFYRSKHPRYF